ncbi:Uncharacterised protein [Klebsiella pneumoniae]|nr:Uncharacterised protein [Klebsiella pneumoniae]
MHTGNQPPFAGGLAQQDLPWYAGPVQDRRRRRPRLLAAQTEWTGNGRYPPRSAARYRPLRDDTRYARAYGRQRARADPGDHLLIINPADLRRAVRQYTANKQHVAPAAIAGVVERGCCQPVSAFPRRQEHRGVGIRWRTSGGQQAADMVRMGVGKKDGVRSPPGPTPSGARLAISSPPTPLAPPVPVSTSTVFPATADQIGANRNGLW